jgi:heme exporter protein B
MKALLALIRCDLLLAMRRRSEVLTALFFFVIVASLFPLAIGPETEQLRKIAPGILWVGALLSSMFGLQRMFAADHADGSLEQMVLSPTPLVFLVFARITAHWLLSGLPLILIAPILALQFDLPQESTWVLTISLLLGTPILSFVGAIGAALTLGVRGGGVLLSLLILPLYIPALIFGAGAVEAEAAGLGAGGHLSILGALLMLSVFFSPWATAIALRIAVE